MSNVRLFWNIFQKIKKEFGRGEIENITPQTKLVFCGEYSVLFSFSSKLYLAIYEDISSSPTAEKFFANNPIFLLFEDDAKNLQIIMEKIPVSENQKLMKMFSLIFGILK